MVDEEDGINLTKLIVIGDQTVGKTSLISNYTDEKSADHRNTMGTIGVNLKKKIQIIENKENRVIIFDTAGHERYRQITKYFFNGCKGIIIVYDVNYRPSFENVSKWIEGLCNIEKDVVILIVGNKIDLERAVSTDELKELAKRHNTLYIETSAKTGEFVNQAFCMILRKISEQKLLNLASTIESTYSITENKTSKEKSNCFCF
jgi:Ras-related protein Rab-18